MDTALRLVTVIILPLVFQRSDVSAQQVNATAANACFSACETRYNDLNTEASARGAFLAKYQNSTHNASDYYCSLTANISACFNNCKQTYPAIFYNKGYILESLTTSIYNCFTDESKCRAQDSILWCTVYSSDSCDSNATNVDNCITDVQAHRGCNLKYPTNLSQRVVLATRLTDLLYCLNDIDSFTLGLYEGDLVQVCTQYVPVVCFSIVLSANGGASYVKDNLTCSDLQVARECIKSTLTEMIFYQKRWLTMPCSYHPYASTLFAKIDIVFSTFLNCSSTNVDESTVKLEMTTDNSALLSEGALNSTTFSAQPTTTQSAQPTLTQSAQPISTQSAQPTITPRVQLTSTQSVQPTATRSAQPTTTQSARSLTVCFATSLIIAASAIAFYSTIW